MAKNTDKKVTVTDFYGKSLQVPLSKLQWRPSAYGIIIKDKKILLLRQINGYDLPGGGIDIGETPEDAVIRETKEETGLTVAHPRLVGVDDSLYFAFLTKDTYYHSLMVYYICDYVSGELSTDGFDEAEKQYAEAPEWFPIDKLDSIKVGSSNDFRLYIKQAQKL